MLQPSHWCFVDMTQLRCLCMRVNLGKVETRIYQTYQGLLGADNRNLGCGTWDQLFVSVATQIEIREDVPTFQGMTRLV